MTHYVCRGEECKTVSDKPNICLSPQCINRYKLLDECDCSHKGNHYQVAVGVTLGGGKHRNSLNVFHFGIALGVVWAFVVFLIGILSGIGWGVGFVSALSGIYIGYGATLMGSVAGAVWALLDGFIFGVLLSWLYNQLEKRRR